MRRSFAPSQVCSGSAKNFCWPQRTTPRQGHVPANAGFMNDVDVDNSVVKHGDGARSTLDLLQLIESSASVESKGRGCRRQDDHGEEETIGRSCAAAVPQCHGSPSDNDVPAVDGYDDARYYSVVWCKLSTRKHKKWEGDAILVVQRQSAVLKDLNGKEIGRGIGYKRSRLDKLDDDEDGGNRLTVGGKEVEVISRISTDAYLSRQCFGSERDGIKSGVCSKQTNRSVPCVKELFVVPEKQYGNLPTKRKLQAGASTIICSRFDPSKPGALVMPRPSTVHQWRYNRNRLPIVDVVVDPVLSCKLRPHQQDGVVFLYECIMQMRNYDGRGALLADDMGLGKTLQCITLIWTLLRQGPYGGRPVLKRVIVVTPSSLVKNWFKEFNHWLGRERINVCATDESEKIVAYAKSPIQSVLITSYELLSRNHELLFAATSFDLIVCDEGHRLKNSSTKTSSLLASLPIVCRIILTGTPVQNDLQEFYSLVEFCNPGILGGTAASFRKVYEEPIIRSRQPDASREEVSLGKSRASQLALVTGLFVLRRTQDVNIKYLLPKVEYIVFCKPSLLQVALYKNILESRFLRSSLKRTNQDGTFHLVCIAALKKLCNHPALIFESVADSAGRLSMQESPYTDLLPLFPPNFDSKCCNPLHSGKLEVLDSLLQSLRLTCPREKVVLVSSYTKTLDVLERLCHDRDYTFCRLDGSTPAATRQSIVDNFNAPHSNLFAFLLSTRAGGVGLNLVGASRIVLYDIDWNPANDLQALSRVWRDGQRRTVHIYRLLTTGTIEEKIYQRQVTKQNLSGAVVDNKENRKVQFTQDDLRDIFIFKHTSPCTTHDLLGCNCFGSKGSEHSLPLVDASSNSPITRSCQLELKKPRPKSQNPSMDELMLWEHFYGPPPSSVEELRESCLLDASSITCTFRNVSSSKGSADVAVVNK